MSTKANSKNTSITCEKHEAGEGFPCHPSGHINKMNFPGLICGSRRRKTKHI